MDVLSIMYILQGCENKRKSPVLRTVCINVPESCDIMQIKAKPRSRICSCGVSLKSESQPPGRKPRWEDMCVEGGRKFHFVVQTQDDKSSEVHFVLENIRFFHIC